MQDEDETNGDGKPSEDTAAAPAPTDEDAPATCAHNWRRCPFYCEGCKQTFAISDDAVAFRRRVNRFEGDFHVAAFEWSDGHVVTELAGWSEGEDPPSWP